MLSSLIGCSFEVTVRAGNVVHGQQVLEAPTLNPPVLQVRRADNRKVETIPWEGTAPPYHAENRTIQATLDYQDNGIWRVRATPKIPLSEITFPAADSTDALVDGSFDNDIVYYPFLFGVIRRAGMMKDWGWWGLDYPGACFSPLLVRADESAAKLVAAVNWPPKRVYPMFCRRATCLTYKQAFAVGETHEFKAMVHIVCREDAPDVPLWAAAVDPYKAWLKVQLDRENLNARLPEWITHANGWLNIQLENRQSFDAMGELAFYRHWKPLFPWVQFWGQMSNYAGPKHLARPSLQPDEDVGCCLEDSSLHARYVADLPRMAAAIRRAGGHVGYYERPRKDANLEDPAERAYIEDWIRKNENEFNADAHYIDVLGASYFGDPLTVATWIRDRLPPSVIEGAVDIYPTAYLISGAVTGGRWGGGPGVAEQVLTEAREMATFTRFGRYVIDDRSIFLGQSNTDSKLWGPKNDYWVERQAFMLGAKLDPTNPYESPGQNLGPANKAIELIIAEWSRVNWWARTPKYRDRAGITNVPERTDVRRFIDAKGVSLLVVDNWNQRVEQVVTVDGKIVEIPSTRLSIIELR